MVKLETRVRERKKYCINFKWGETMKVVFHERYREVYAGDPAAAPGRLDGIVEELRDSFEFVEPAPATEADLLLVHTQRHLERIKKRELLYEIAVLAAGGAIEAARLALQGEPAFALIRPPGHHASPDSCWGFCWFNNVAVAVEKVRRSGKIEKAVIIDIDLHFGDGTNNIFAQNPHVKYYHLDSINELENFLRKAGKHDLVAISAGFDRHVADWGGMLKTDDYTTLGEIIGSYAKETCDGKVFAVLEGGYNHDVLGKNVKALLTGLQKTV